MEKQEQIDVIIAHHMELINKLEHEKALLDYNIIKSFKTMNQDNIALISYEFYDYMDKQMKICDKINEKYKYMTKEVYELNEVDLRLMNKNIDNYNKSK
jgi:hypothetical protein